ncbi:BTAD domain-containing putative transcriptional regulator [Micromonospora sp. WMMD882]|uniref:AfsR/SARP family transcriptional regulator n=1 Tax=Micromonospora sp. WMMD882 TaxID=3015151 RepID=UPI00248D2B92|nr:BTAD domain-containing putative transcriptional regulator [Micromonospora sp. WMMD882]WBB80552.1 BTAD domain-containing putative transcriptional regulator [Micromonospora sp. WMMD882]
MTVAATDVDLCVLGPVSARRDHEPVALGGRRQRMVLAALLVARGRTLPAERLRELVWGDHDRTASRATLYGYIAGLRRALEPQRASRSGGLLVREGPGYAIRLPPDRVDADRFTALVGHGGVLLDRGRSAEAVSTLETALALWRGPAYADVGDTPFALPEVTRLESLRATAVELRLTALLDLGRHAAVLGELQALVLEHPLRERAWELLALALYRLGRQGDALGVLHRARRRLAERLGVDPGPALRRLETAILSHDESLAPATGAVAAGPARPGGGNLPTPVSSFVGRAADLADVRAAVAAHRLVTLTGPAGVGKTRLAIELARRRADADGPWLVELAELRSPGAVVGALAAALGAPAGDLGQLTAVLADRATLLVVDNAEHLLPGLAPVVGELLARCPRLRILTTSREALDTPGERVVTIPPLPPADAVALLTDRATAAGAPTDDPAVAARLCADLDGLPLAIELAAAQCRALSLTEVAHRMTGRFALLAAGPHGPPRHRSLADAIGWSCRRLTGRQRRLLNRLSVLDGAFDLDAARRVGAEHPGDEGVVVDLVALVRKSLVTVDTTCAPRRFALLSCVRAYAADQLDAPATGERVRTGRLRSGRGRAGSGRTGAVTPYVRRVAVSRVVAR